MVVVSVVSSRDGALRSVVMVVCRVGAVGVVRFELAAGRCSSLCRGNSVRLLTSDRRSVIWCRWRWRSCSRSAAVGGALHLVGSGVGGRWRWWCYDILGRSHVRLKFLSNSFILVSCSSCCCWQLRNSDLSAFCCACMSRRPLVRSTT